jgi:hypothetical protein
MRQEQAFYSQSLDFAAKKQAHINKTVDFTIFE